ncbi:MAG: hypothetical protein ACYDH9_26075 [Limisphaerales bacterium]
MNNQLYVGGNFQFLVGNNGSSVSITNLAVFSGGGFASVGNAPVYQAPGFLGLFGGIYALAV